MAKKRHIGAYKLGRAILAPIIKNKLNYSGDVVNVGPRPTIIMANHVTNLDMLIVGMSFPKYMYFVASEHIFRWGFVSRLMKFFFAPIPRFKGKVEANTALEILRSLKAGNNVFIFPEGTMTMDGITMDIIPSNGKLVKFSKADLVTFKIEGSYLTAPRWADKMRKGKTKGTLVGYYMAEDLEKMSADEINALIQRDIHVDPYEDQKKDPIRYRGKGLAESIEKALFFCPKCLKIASIHSSGNTFSCSCGLECTYTEFGFIEGNDVPFSTVAEWINWQTKFAREYIDSLGADDILCSDVDQSLSIIEPFVKSTYITTGNLTVTKKALTLGEYVFPIENISSIIRASKLKFAFSTKDGKDYEVNSKIIRSAFKYQTLVSILISDLRNS